MLLIGIKPNAIQLCNSVKFMSHSSVHLLSVKIPKMSENTILRGKLCHIYLMNLHYPQYQLKRFDLLLLTDHFALLYLDTSLLTSWQLQAKSVAQVLCWGDSSTARARHLRGDRCAYITNSTPQPSYTSPVNAYGSEAYLSKTQEPSLSSGSRRLFLLSPAGTWPSTPTTNNH